MTPVTTYRLTPVALCAVAVALLTPLPGCAQDRPADAREGRDGREEEVREGDARGPTVGGQLAMDPVRTEADWRAAVAADPGDLPARLGLAEYLWNRGRRAEADSTFRTFVTAYNRTGEMSADELIAVGDALTYLGRERPELLRDAVRAYEEAIDAAPRGTTARIALAELFLDKYDSREAGELLGEALELAPEHPRALLGMARRARFDGSSASFDYVRRALDVAPDYADAHAFLAELHLELEEVERAEAAARRALEVDPDHLPAWGALAAAAHLRGDEAGFAAARDRVLSIDPAHGKLYVTLAELAYRTRRYEDAVTFARQGVELDDHEWAAHAALGLNLLRVGEMAAGRRALEDAYAGDPFNPWVVNTLDLLDELDGFETVESPRFRFRLHPDEAGVLAVYAPALAEEAFDRMAERYAYRPPTPITVEVYDRHEEFSVRTVGLTGLGALGVAFGSVLAMDSPGARPAGEFTWGATLWHEISHAFTLGATEHRTPRWFSEGLAVLDERRARTGWGMDVDPGFLLAFRDDRLPTLERFDMGFVRPAYPGQVGHSYLLASLLCEWIEETHGLEAIRAMLAGYRDGLDTEAVFAASLDADVPAVQAELTGWIEARYASALASLEGVGPENPPPPGSFPTLLIEAQEARAAGQADRAIALFDSARAVFPDYTGPGAPSLALARLHAEAGRDSTALAAYRDFTSRNESDLDARREQAALERALGDRTAERETLASAVWIEPFDASLLSELAAAREATGDWTGAVRERRALVALAPTDLAAAWYELARAHHRSGDAAAARSAVLRALEVAPNYDEALDLLVTLREEGGS